MASTVRTRARGSRLRGLAVSPAVMPIVSKPTKA